MSRTAFRPEIHAGILRQVFDVPGRGMTRPLAESILDLDFPEEAGARIETLNGKANEGTLTDDEAAELQAYSDVGDLLAYWQSKARQHLQQTA